MAVGNAVRALARTLRELAKAPARVSAPFATYVTTQLREGLLSGLDPYGNPLPPLKAATVRRKGHSRILQRSLELLATTIARPLSGSGVGLEVGPDYAHRHITGNPPRMVARKFLPTNVMPAKWRVELRRLLHERMKAGLR